MSRQEAYGYAVARVRAMELRLLDANVIRRMIDADDTAAVVKILGETNYASALAAQTGANYDKAFEENLLATYSEFNSFVPDKELVALMRLQYDFHNVKVILKSIFNSKNGGKRRYELLTSLASYPVDELISKIETEDYQLLPYGLHALIPECISEWEHNGNVLEVERMLDDGLFNAMYQIAAKLDMPGVTNWVRAKIDGENIRTLVRLKRFGYEASKVLPFLHGNGLIEKETVASLISEPMDMWIEAIRFPYLKNYVNTESSVSEKLDTWGKAVIYFDLSKAIETIDTSANFSELILELEKSLDEFYSDMLKQISVSKSGPEIVLAYLIAKDFEVKNIRTILVTKGGNQDKELLRRLLRNGNE